MSVCLRHCTQSRPEYPIESTYVNLFAWNDLELCTLNVSPALQFIETDALLHDGYLSYELRTAMRDVVLTAGAVGGF